MSVNLPNESNEPNQVMICYSKTSSDRAVKDLIGLVS
jgi:hypothetical protein